MLTRSKTVSQKRTCKVKFHEWTEAEKDWIDFKNMYPCFNQDPLQMYMKYHLDLPKSDYTPRPPDDTLQVLKNTFFTRHKSSLYFVSEHLSIFKYAFLEKKWGDHPRENFYSVPAHNRRSKLKMMIDMIVTKEFLQSLDPSLDRPDTKDGSASHKSAILLLASSDKISEYQRYKAHFAVRVLSNHSCRIDLDHVYFYDLKTEKVSCLTIHDEKEIGTYQKDIGKYIQWIRNCIHYGDTYTLLPPSHPFLYPNMKVECDNSNYQKWKMDYALQLNEITLLYKCHPKHRENMHNKGVYSFLDPKFRVKDLHVQHQKDEVVLEEMLSMYKSKTKQICGVENVVFPETSHSFFVDFETLDDRIYWIGAGVWDGKEYLYKEFVSRFNTLEEQGRIMKEFSEWLKTYPSHTVYYWWAEERFWHRSEKMLGYSVPVDFGTWMDLCHVFSNTPIIVKNCFNFKLKTIAKEMKRMNMIEIVCPQECSGGEESMVLAKQYFQHHTTEDYRKLHKYNYFDCRVMFEILYFVKNKKKC